MRVPYYVAFPPNLNSTNDNGRARRASHANFRGILLAFGLSRQRTRSVKDWC